jgi:hypothetical protein
MAELRASSFDAKWFGRATWSTAVPTEKQLVDAEMRARALSRWENEGGSLVPTGAADSIDESELRILARLGAALLDEWGALPRAVQGNCASAREDAWKARRSRAGDGKTRALSPRKP